MVQVFRKRGTAWKQHQQGEEEEASPIAVQRQQQENNILQVTH